MSYCVAEKSHQTGDWDFWGRCWGLKQTNKIEISENTGISTMYTTQCIRFMNITIIN